MDEKEMKDLISELKRVLDLSKEPVDVKSYGSEDAMTLVDDLIGRQQRFVPVPIMSDEDGEFLLQQNQERMMLLDLTRKVGGSLEDLLDKIGPGGDEECNCPSCQANRLLEREDEITGENKTRH